VRLIRLITHQDYIEEALRFLEKLKRRILLEAKKVCPKCKMRFITTKLLGETNTYLQRSQLKLTCNTCGNEWIIDIWGIKDYD
jgi:RNase P subunit RPR2